MEDKLSASLGKLGERIFNAGKKAGKEESSGKKGESAPKTPEYKKLEKIASTVASSGATTEMSELRKVLKKISVDKELDEMNESDVKKVIVTASEVYIQMKPTETAPKTSKPE